LIRKGAALLQRLFSQLTFFQKNTKRLAATLSPAADDRYVDIRNLSATNTHYTATYHLWPTPIETWASGCNLSTATAHFRSDGDLGLDRHR